MPFGCGQCLPCRINRSRLWAWRQFLESMLHEENGFVTLTYDEEHLPADRALVKRDLQLFLKRLRKAVDPIRVRYFAVGEYGEDSKRPHYHLTLFGMSRFSVHDSVDGPITGEEVVKRCWPFGYSLLAEFNEATAQYVSRYVVKHLKDRKAGNVFPIPEFATMSLRPGLGAGAMDIVAKALNETVQNWESGDVVSSLRIGRRSIPLGRYLIKNLRQRVGFTDEYIAQIKEEASFQKSLDMLAVFSNLPEAFTIKEAYKTDIAQKISQVENRYNIWLSKRSL